jgi:hypothetical protein
LLFYVEKQWHSYSIIILWISVIPLSVLYAGYFNVEVQYG